ncbi:MAG: glycosyltransferase, partial [Synergistaceae bacterium]|nr:glycosyltransferase [Synergistaceae bacterium]
RAISLPGLEKSTFRDFVCVVWDASGDDATREAMENGNWSFEVFYAKAPRVGSSSQRNDAVLHVQKTWPKVRYVVFIDDDTELSSDALEGVCATFRDPKVWGVNIPLAPGFCRLSKLQRRLHEIFLLMRGRPGRRIMLPCLHNYIVLPEICGAEVDWTVGCGMAFRMEAFTSPGTFFPEPFQYFGGYALGEDFAFSFYLKHRLKRKIVNSLCGNFIHHSAAGGRSNVKNLFAARWFNMSLLFEEIYRDSGFFLYYSNRIVFSAHLLIYFIYFALRCRTFDVLRGLCAGSGAFARERKNTAGALFKYGSGNGS